MTKTVKEYDTCIETRFICVLCNSSFVFKHNAIRHLEEEHDATKKEKSSQ